MPSCEVHYDSYGGTVIIYGPRMSFYLNGTYLEWQAKNFAQALEYEFRVV